MRSDHPILGASGWVVWPAVLLLAVGCTGTTPSVLEPRLSAALREQPMRRMDTRSLQVYYPESQKEEARRVAQRLETCVRELNRRKEIRNSGSDRKYVVLMPKVAFNNAYVLGPTASLGPFSLIPTMATLNIQVELGLPLDPAIAGCHEMVHYVHLTQVAGFWNVVNVVFGDVLTPQIGLESWFAEGLATYYEGKLQPGIGRLAWPVWRGMFHAGVAGEDLDGGQLSALHRPFHWGNHYLVGSHFIEFLVDRYGEERLWKLIARQGRSFFFPLGVNLRFRSAYGRTLGGLFDEFKETVAQHFAVRPRPPGQALIRDAGENTRYVTGLDGSEAMIVASGDIPARLVVHGPDGKQRTSRDLQDVLPLRDVVAPSPTFTTGLSFTADGRHVYFVAADQGSVQLEARLIRYDVAEDQLEIVRDDIRGIGGSVSPTGDRYFFSHADGDRHDLAVMDLRSGAVRVLRRAGPRSYYADASPDPSGRKLVVSYFDGKTFSVQVLESDSGKMIDTIGPGPVPVYGGAFRDDDRILYLAPVDGVFQVHEYSLASRTSVQVTHAPYLAFAPHAKAGQVRFLNRQGWGWTLDAVALPARSQAPAPGQANLGGGVASPGSTGPVDEPLAIESDEAYRWFDHLFVPNLRALAVLGVDTETSLLGLTLTGSDRLQFHRWGLSFLYQPYTYDVSGVVQYFNRQLAPVEIGARASRIEWGTGDDLAAGGDPDATHLQLRGTLALYRTFWTTNVAVGGDVIDDRVSAVGTPGQLRRSLGGPFAQFEYEGVESTPYAGPRRGLIVGASGTYFPEQASTFDESFGDVRGWIQLVSPLPLSTRHTLDLELRARALPGQPEPLLEVGGNALQTELYRHSSRPDADDFSTDLLPDDIAFFEPLRGYEDYGLVVDRIGIGTLVYRYPFSIDYGVTSLLWFLPSFLLRQFDLELFAAGAFDRFQKDNLHYAAGASLELSAALGSMLGLGVRYQLARRLTDDEALVHLIMVTF